MRLSFLTPPQDLLTPDGRFVCVERGQGLLTGPPRIWISRGLCAHAAFDPGRARGAAAWAAARLHARLAAPFVNAGSLVERSGRGFSIWWWDLDRVGPALAERFGEQGPPCAPEAFAPPAGDGWRILKLEMGFEAQLWRDGGLAASAWSRAMFDAPAWSALTRGLARQGPAPSDPPAPIVAPRAAFPANAALAGRLTPRRLAELAAMALVVVLLGAAAFWLGQGLRLRGMAKETEALAAAERAATRPASAGRVNAVRRLAAFHAFADRPRVIEGLAVALQILDLYGVGLEAVDVQGDELTLTLPYAAIGSVDRLAQEMEASGRFADVQPASDAAARSIRLRMRLT